MILYFFSMVISKFQERTDMNKFIILMLSFALSSTAFASLQTASFRTKTGQLLKIGDHSTEMVTRLAQSPLVIKSQAWEEGPNLYPALEYTYEINNIIYVITVANDVIKKIEFERLAQ